MNSMYNTNDMRLMQIEHEISKAESNKRTACIMMFISIFFLWPLLIFGAIKYKNAKEKIDELNDEKKQIMFQNYFSNQL